MYSGKKEVGAIRKVIAQLIIQSRTNLASLRHEINHSLNTLEWLRRIESSPSLALQFASLLHDCERLDNINRTRKKKFTSYKKFKKAHSKNSALVASKILRTLKYQRYTKSVVEIILLHEFGGTPDADILKDADSLSFFDKNIIEYFQHNGIKASKKKITFMYSRMSPPVQRVVLQKNFDFKKIPSLKKYLSALVNKQHSLPILSK